MKTSKIIEVDLDKIQFDEEIYPRKSYSNKTVEEYVTALEGGENFPPIEVQRIKGGDGMFLCLDGRHRVLACFEYNKKLKKDKNKEIPLVKKIVAFEWREDEIDKQENYEALLIESAKRNMTHGDRLSGNDFGEVLNKIVRARPLSQLKDIRKELTVLFGRSYSYISSLVQDELGKRTGSRDAKIFYESLLGFTQEEIAARFDLTQQAVGEITKIYGIGIFGNLAAYREGQKSIPELASFLDVPEIMLWAVAMNGLEDEKRFTAFGDGKNQDDKPKWWNVWNFTKLDTRLGQKHPGNIPGQIALNVLYHYTKQNDLVIDPMAGGGSTIDACLVMGRKIRAYDINPLREDILKWDLSQGFPEEAKGCNLVFYDPPYWRLEAGLYVGESISEVGLEEWRNFMKKTIEDTYVILKKGGHVAFVIEPFLDEKITKKFLDLSCECWKWFVETGFEQIQRISVPMPSEIKSPQDVIYAKEHKILLDLNRDLLIFKKV
jgi:hypothetical protein